MEIISKWISRIPRELRLFLLAIAAMGMATSMVDATFNNFLNEKYALNGIQRSLLEFPREFPGFSVVFVAALLWFLGSRKLGVVAMLLGVAGTLLIGFAAPVYGVMLVWLFFLSLGQHLFMPLYSSIGMELAREGQMGRRLGQLNAVRNLAAIGGSFLVYLGFRFLGLNFQYTFALAALAYAAAAMCLFFMKPEKAAPVKTYLKLHKEYRLYYWLAVLFGSRKQIFLTFAPWVLVTVFHQPTQTLATLLTIGGVVGVLFQPLLGWATDHLGERFVLAAEAFLLVFVCFGYGFAKFLVPEKPAFYIACVCFLLDQMLMSVNMARSTYMKKISLDPSHVQPALTVAVTIDHVFSIGIALVGGIIWNFWGFQYVFLLGVLIAIVNFFTALRVRIPKA